MTYALDEWEAVASGQRRGARLQVHTRRRVTVT